MALADDSAFLRRFMTLPFDVPTANFRKTLATLAGDEGINFSTRRRPRPAEAGAGGRHRHLRRADASGGRQRRDPRRDAGTRARSSRRSRRSRVRLLGFGQARVPLALDARGDRAGGAARAGRAGLAIRQIDAIKTHNPFALNDLLFAREMGVDSANDEQLRLARWSGGIRRRRWARGR